MHHSQSNISQAASFLEAHFKINSVDSKNLAPLFEAYQTPAQSHTQITDQRIAAAYVIARGLSIAGVIRKILFENSAHLEHVKSVIDFGGGPGTFLLESADHMELESYTNIDTNSSLLSIFALLSKYLSFSTKITTHRQDYLSYSSKTRYDLGVMSYTLCENKDPQKLVEKSSSMCDQLLIIEPGTPHGYQNILKARTFLKDSGYFITAPCTTLNTCPLAESDTDWCHFVTRLERSRAQMMLKNAQLGYEDEKYCFLLAQKEDVDPVDKVRIISKPKITPKYSELFFCGDGDYKDNKLFATKKTYKETYKTIKKSKRGDLINREP